MLPPAGQCYNSNQINLVMNSVIRQHKNIRHAIREYRPLVKCSLGDLSLYGLVDTGNSTMNAISSQLAKLLFGNDLSLALEHISTKIGTAKKGVNLKVLGRCKEPLNFQFNGVSRIFKTRPIVIEGLNTALNISGPFLHHNRIDHLISKNAIRVDSKLVPLTRPDLLPKNAIYYTAELPEVSTPAPPPLINRTSVPISKANSSPTPMQIAEIEDIKDQYRSYLLNDQNIPPWSVTYVRIRLSPTPKTTLTGVLEVSTDFMSRTECHPAIRAFSI